MITVTPDSRIQVRNILLATDFSSTSEAALPHALALTRRYDARLLIAHVIRPDLFDLVPKDHSDAVQESVRRHAEEQIARLLVSGRLRGVPHQVLVGEGPLWNVLAHDIEEHEVDLVVVGTHGRTGSRKLLLGSVAEEIFRLARCPVLTVGPRVTAGSCPVESPKSVLYATDFRVETERAAAYAISLAQENQAHLLLLHVVKDAAPSASNAHILLEFFTRRLKGLVPQEAELWCEPEFLVDFGDPAEVILRFAQERCVELIVLGIRRTGTFAGHLPPATAYKVVCRAQCPVLTVRG